MKRLLVIVGLVSTACGSVPHSHAGPVVDQVSLIDALRATLTVEVTGSVAQPSLMPQSGTTIRVGGASLAAPADLQLYEYLSAAAAGADAHQIRGDGSTAMTIIDWVAPPHFYLKGRVLVIYVGRDQAVVRLLTSLLGPQVAGS